MTLNLHKITGGKYRPAMNWRYLNGFLRNFCMDNNKDAGKALGEIEKDANEIYNQVLAPLAEKYYFELPSQPGGTTRKPTVLLLGNHSAGKSAFINYLLGTEIQRTGLAPVDDSFTIISAPASRNCWICSGLLVWIL